MRSTTKPVLVRQVAMHLQNGKEIRSQSQQVS